MTSMRILHCVSGIGLGSGGTSVCVPALAQAQARLGHEVTLAYVAGEDDLTEPDSTVHALVGTTSRPHILRASTDLRRALIHGPRFDIYHAHGLWQLPPNYALAAARRHGAPALLTAHGMLEPWALGHSKLVKQAMTWLYQRRMLKSTNCMHAITPMEVASFRAYGLNNPITVVPNGVDLSELDVSADPLASPTTALEDMFRRPSVLFMSRLHPKKGLLNLVAAWAALRDSFPDWLLIICGPDERGHRSKVEQQVADLGVGDSVRFTGPLYGADKLAAYRGARLFVLPSYSEGFSMAILEAMAARLPVIITPGCNFPEVAEHGAGLIVAPDLVGVMEGLRQMMSLSDDDRAAMAVRGRKLIEERYTWDRIAVQMIEVYEWLLGRRSSPAHVK